MEKLKEKLIIDRSKWLRGEGPSRSYLLRAEDGKMCCLGFECLLRGQKEDDILLVKMPSAILIPTQETEALIAITPSLLLQEAATINDARLGISFYIGTFMERRVLTIESEEQREKLIADLFDKHIGRVVEFI